MASYKGTIFNNNYVYDLVCGTFLGRVGELGLFGKSYLPVIYAFKDESNDGESHENNC